MPTWSEIYRDAVYGDIKLVKAVPPEGVVDLGTVKPCRVVPCPGTYFPAHDAQCEMDWEEDNTGRGWFTDCNCEPRARDQIGQS